MTDTTREALPFLTCKTPPAVGEVLAAAHDVDFAVREIANGKRKPGKLPIDALAVLVVHARALAAQAAPVQAVAWQWRKRIKWFEGRAEETAFWTEWEPLVPPYLDARDLATADPENYQLRALGVIATPSAAPQQAGETPAAGKTPGHRMLLRFCRSGECLSNVDGTVTVAMTMVERIAAALARPAPDAAIADRLAEALRALLHWDNGKSEYACARIYLAAYDASRDAAQAHDLWATDPEAAMKRLHENGSKAWAGVSDATAWVDELRGMDPSAQAGTVEGLAEEALRAAIISTREYVLGFCSRHLESSVFDHLRRPAIEAAMVAAVLGSDSVRAALAAYDATKEQSK